MRPLRLLAFLHAGGDEAALIPVLDEARNRGFAVRACATERFARRFPEAIERLDAAGWRSERVGGFASRWLRRPSLSAVDALITATETSLEVHRTAHELTHRANRRGVPTYTLQQGLENVGLTYFDEPHGPNVSIAASRILTWGPLETLPPELPDATRARCVPVGATKPFAKRKAPERSRLLVVVFENLHRRRYADSFRMAFLDAVWSAATAAPDVDFVLKPHPKSRWSAEAVSAGAPPNLRVADQTGREAGPVLAAEADRVITTPSTVALDAAVAGTPVALAAFGLDVGSYAPLDALSSAADIEAFVRRGQPPEVRRPFVDRLLLPGDAAARAVDAIAAGARQAR